MTEDMMTGRVRALLAKAEHPDTDIVEAEVYFEKANQLIAKYGIDRALLAATDTSKNANPTSRLFEINGEYALDQARLWHMIAQTNRCTTVRTQDTRKMYDEYGNYTGRRSYSIHIVGYAEDIEIVELLFTTLHLQISNQLQHVRGDKNLFITTKTARCNYFAGFRDRMWTRLLKAQADAKSEAVASIESGEEKKSTELALIDCEAKVQEELKNLFPNLKKGINNRRAFSPGHYRAGESFGDKAILHSKSVVGSSSSRELN
jgi:Protein of unknown function (DUF2786)